MQVGQLRLHGGIKAHAVLGYGCGIVLSSVSLNTRRMPKLTGRRAIVRIQGGGSQPAVYRKKVQDSAVI